MEGTMVTGATSVVASAVAGSGVLRMVLQEERVFLESGILGCTVARDQLPRSSLQRIGGEREREEREAI
jgi:hypothetical protein